MYKRSLCISFGVLFLLHLSSSYTYKQYFFKQKVDHFGYVNTDYFAQRYLMNTDHWDPEVGSIFLYTGNEGDIEMFANNAGFMWESAPKFNALLLFIEHRYYGQSLPYGSEGLKNFATRGYLNSEQALADFITLLSHLKSTIPGAKNSRVIAFGGSYGGMLAAWIRMKYPHLVDGAIASSAPIFQFKNLTPCELFSEITTNDFLKASPLCVDCIRRSWSVLRNYGSTGQGATWLSSVFNLCEKITPYEIDSLINWIISTWIFLATTNYPYPTNFLIPLPGHPVNAACSYLTDPKATDAQLVLDVVKAISVFHNYTGEIRCFNLSKPAGGSLGADGWDYQACTEMVMPMCQTFKTDMFEASPWDFGEYAKSCLARWQSHPDIEKAIITYGGRNLKAASNIIFTNGDLDPWISGGVLESVSDTVIAILIQGGAHHMDLRASNPDDPPSVIRARQIELSWIAKWTRRN